MTNSAALETKLEGIPLVRRGKVRDLYDLGEHLLMVATDRISAFDCILPTGIPDKGRVLTALSEHWFGFTKDICPNHLITTDFDAFPAQLGPYRDLLAGRSMLVKKAERIEIECVVRGYLAGSGWKEYSSSGTVCGAKLPAGMKEADPLPQPIFTPATKADSGHDENISVEQMAGIVGDDLARALQEKTTRIYTEAASYAGEKGMIIADCKFEFGFHDGQMIVIDEMLTPDSSRFWPKESYSPGRGQASFDKQFVRDYLEGLDWDKTPPAPPLPADIVEKTREKYLEAYRRLVGRELAL